MTGDQLPVDSFTSIRDIMKHVRMIRIFSSNSAALLGFFMLLVLHTATAQNRFAVELRGGADFPAAELGGADLKTGFGLEGTFAYRFIPRLSAFAGWSWNRFASDQSFAGADVDFEETGYQLGLRFSDPIGSSPVHYLLGAAGLYNHLEAENAAGDIIGDTGHGLGWQAEAGIVIPLGERWSLSPLVRYRSLSREFNDESFQREVDLNYVSASLGIAWSF